MASLSGCAVVTVTSAVVGTAVSVTTTAVGLAVDGTVAAGKGVVAVGGMAADAMSSKPSASEASAVSVRPSP
ncbi:hypothetical protein [Jeongeupia sp. HS-3]|uniref:hypothetical protein n=1 Tax=Jeongeupia sp. HS-3 TaxID=1009682 RepID=UPI00190FE462|nr:hypothetical protein [Jeongeupia sp. HS-3]